MGPLPPWVVVSSLGLGVQGFVHGGVSGFGFSLAQGWGLRAYNSGVGVQGRWVWGRGRTSDSGVSVQVH